MNVDLVIPAPIRHIPPRARVARVSYVPTVVPVRIREMAWTDTEAGPTLLSSNRRRIQTRLVDGEAWRVIGRDDARGDTRDDRWPGRDEFRRWLEGDPRTEGLDRTDTARAFAGTPVVARPFDRNVLLRGRREVPPASVGLVLVDHREAAQAAAIRLFERDVAHVGGVPMMRLMGPVAFRGHGNWFASRAPGAWTNEHQEAWGLFHRLDRIPASGAGIVLTGTPGYGWDPAAAARLRYRGDEDVALTLSHAAGRLAWSIVHAGWEDATPEGIALRDRILDLACAASAWLVADEDLPAMLDVVGEGARRLERAGSDQPGVLSRVLEYVRDFARPVLAARAAPVEDEDAEAIASLGR